MRDCETSHTTYEVIYRVKNGKKMRRAYVGTEKAVYEQVVQELEQRSDIRYLAKSITQTEVTLYD